MRGKGEFKSYCDCPGEAQEFEPRHNIESEQEQSHLIHCGI